MAGDVGDGGVDGAVVGVQHVDVVAADVLRGDRTPCEGVFVGGRRLGGQQTTLDRLGDLQFAGDRAVVGRDGLELQAVQQGGSQLAEALHAAEPVVGGLGVDRGIEQHAQAGVDAVVAQRHQHDVAEDRWCAAGIDAGERSVGIDGAGQDLGGLTDQAVGPCLAAGAAEVVQHRLGDAERLRELQAAVGPTDLAQHVQAAGHRVHHRRRQAQQAGQHRLGVLFLEQHDALFEGLQARAVVFRRLFGLGVQRQVDQGDAVVGQHRGEQVALGTGEFAADHQGTEFVLLVAHRQARAGGLPRLAIDLAADRPRAIAELQLDAPLWAMVAGQAQGCRQARLQVQQFLGEPAAELGRRTAGVEAGHAGRLRPGGCRWWWLGRRHRQPPRLASPLMLSAMCSARSSSVVCQASWSIAIAVRSWGCTVGVGARPGR